MAPRKERPAQQESGDATKPAPIPRLGARRPLDRFKAAELIARILDQLPYDQRATVVALAQMGPRQQLIPGVDDAPPRSP